MDKAVRKRKKTPSLDETLRKVEGWTIYILECADGRYYRGMTKNMIKSLAEDQLFRISRKTGYPVKVAFLQRDLPFKEARVKMQYLKSHSQRVTARVVKYQRFPLVGPFKDYILSLPFSEFQETKP